MAVINTSLQAELNAGQFGRRTGSVLSRIFGQLLDDQNPPGNQPIVQSSAMTTGLTQSGAMTTGILQSGAMTTGISMTSAMTNGLSLSGTYSTAGINISGAEAVGISINTSTPVDGILISAACADAIHISGTNTASGLHISGDQLIAILYDVTAAATDALKVAVPTGITLTTGINMTCTGTGTITNAISITYTNSATEAIAITMPTTKTLTTGMSLSGAGTYTTGILLDATAITTGISISAGSMTDAILISGTTPVDGLHISSACSGSAINLGASATGITIAAQTTMGINLAVAAGVGGIAIDAGTINHAADGSIIDINLDVEGQYSVNAINVNLDFETTGMAGADVSAAFKADINELLVHTDGAGLYGSTVTLTGFATGRCDLIGHLVTLDGSKTAGDTSTGFKAISTQTINHSGEVLYGQHIDFSGITHTDGSIYGQYIDLSFTNTAASTWGTFYLLGNYGTAISIDAGTTDIDTASDLIFIDMDMNAVGSNAISMDIDVGTALGAAELVNGISINIDGNAGDDGTAEMRGLFLTSANTTTGLNYGIDIEGAWDTGIFIEAAQTHGIYITGASATAGIGVTQTLAANDDHAIEVITTSAATGGSVRPIHMVSTLTGVGAVGGRAEFEMTSNVALGGWANGLKGYFNMGDACTVSGLGSAICAEMKLPGASLGGVGSYGVLEIELVTQASGLTGGAPVAFQWMQVSGDGTATADWEDNGYFMIVKGLTEGTGNIYSAGADVACNGTLRVLIGSTTHYLMLAAGESN